jgi:prophage maintenance system killer protein
LPAIDAFEGIQKEWESDGKDVKWYKEPEIDKIISAIDRVEFGETVPEVGGQILSSFITEHPLPNANHRVALSYLEMYLSMYDPDFELPKAGITGQWEDWARNYVYKSKRIMTLARKTGLLRTLRDYGADEVLRDGDNVIEFADYNLDRDNYLHYHKYEHHLDESIAFTTGVLDRTGNPELLSKEDRGREEFIERLSS